MEFQRISGGNKRVVQVQREARRSLTKERRQRFLDTLAATCNVTLSAREAGIDQAYCYRLRAHDAGFAEAWRAALAMGYERLEEALVGYALARVEAAGIDPGAVDPADIDGSIHATMARGEVSTADLHFALGLLTRLRATLDGRPPRGGRAPKRATRAETDALLRKKLDSLARRMEGK